MAFRPMHDRVLVRRMDEDSKTARIITPDSAQEKPSQGVIAVGTGLRINTVKLHRLM